MSTWSKVEVSADAGATANSFDSIGTVRLNSQARMIEGLWLAAAPITTTTAEAISGQFRFNLSDQKIGILTLNGPPSTGAAVGTQSQGNTFEAVLLPVKIPTAPNQTIPMEFSTNLPDPTAGCSVVMGVLYSDGNVHPGFREKMPNPTAFMSSDTESLADGSTTAESAITDLEIPGWARRVVALGIDTIHDAVAANGEEMAGFMRFRSSIAGWDPQEYPLKTISAPLAGTIVGSGMWSSRQNYWPISFPTSKGNDTITGSSVLTAAVTGAVSQVVSAQWEGVI